MNTFILVVILHVYSGNTVSFQEFKTLEQCKYVRELVSKRTEYGYLVDSFCVQK